MHPTCQKPGINPAIVVPFAKVRKMKLAAVIGLLMFVGVGLALGANFTSTTPAKSASTTCACSSCCPDGGCCCENGVCACKECQCDCCAVGSQTCESACCADKATAKQSSVVQVAEQATCPKCPPETPTKNPKKLN